MRQKKRFQYEIIFKILIFMVTLNVSCLSFSSTDEVLDPIRSLPIQDGGRIKPLDTFSREALSLVYGKETFEGRPSLEVVMTWLLQPQAWEKKEFIEIKHHLLKKALKFDETRKYFSLEEILENSRLSMLMQDLQNKRESKAKLDPYFQALQRLEGQVIFFRGVASGELFRMVPASPNWLSVNQWSEEQQQVFTQMNKIFISYLGKVISKDSSGLSELKLDLQTQVDQFKNLARKQNPSLYADETKIQYEVSFNRFHPFQKAWIFYFLSFVFLGLIWIIKKKFFYYAGWLFSGIGFLLHIYGFGLRMYLTGRPPVSNMYETVVWVGFGVILFAMIIEAIYKWEFILLAGSLVAGFCLLLADNAPVILDPSLQPLQAVLNSNFWLTTHVLTITISYAAFFLAFALGDLGLFYFFRGYDEGHIKIQTLTLAIYRSIQIGVGLLAPGIILGGIWADYSWGRFWGWDPKETWALIALLGYIAVLHGRIAGLIRSFGLIVSSIVTFSLVIMAWYGVNYILGAGLHSYGFGAGGVEYVALFVGSHIFAVFLVTISRQNKTKTLKH